MTGLVMSGTAIQMAVLNTALGIAIAGLIEGVLPPHTEGSSVQQVAFELMVQAGLNGVALALVAGVLSSNDPTYGIPFATALTTAQPALQGRIRSLGAVASGQVTRVVQQTALHAAVDGQPILAS